MVQRIHQDKKPQGRISKKKIDGLFRARLVAWGYTQIPGVDFTENY